MHLHFASVSLGAFLVFCALFAWAKDGVSDPGHLVGGVLLLVVVAWTAMELRHKATLGHRHA